jgi:hypothetical protein
MTWWLSTRWWIHANMTKETSWDPCYWTSDHNIMLTVTVKHFKICIARSRTNLCVNALMASCCCTIPIPMRPLTRSPGPTECHVMRDAQTSCSCTQPRLIATQFSCFWIINNSPQRIYIQMAMCRRLWHSGVSSSPRNSLQMGHSNMWINVTPV